MATAEQLKALLKSHANRDDARFYSVAMQVAAKEARQGHNRLAADIKSLVEKSQKDRKPSLVSTKALPLTQTKSELNGLLELSPVNVRVGQLVYSPNTEERLQQVLLEQRQKDKLSRFGLQPRRKLLFTGSPGTGKTISASMLASELNLPLYTIVLDSLITRFMGETATKLRLIFDHIKQTRAVYLFDEFDAIGAQRGMPNEVGEIRRVLNSFLLFVEQDSSESVLVAATNHPELLDQALYRRFDDIIEFHNPGEEQIALLIRNRLISFDTKGLDWATVSSEALGLSSAEITRSCEDAAKEAVLQHQEKLNTDTLIKAFTRRKSGKASIQK